MLNNNKKTHYLDAENVHENENISLIKMKVLSN